MRREIVRRIVWGLISERALLMSAYLDPTGRWRFRTRVRLAHRKSERISGSSPARDNTRRAALAAEHAAVEAVLHPQPEEVPSKLIHVPTVREFAPRFLDEYAATHKPSERRSKERALAHLRPYFGALRLDEIRQSHVQQFIAAQRRKVSAKTVNNRLAVLSSLLRYAAKNEIITAPSLRFKSGDEIEGRKLSAVASTDIERLVTACTDGRYRVAILLAAEAGLRAGEIRALQWGDVRDGVITVRRSLDNETDEVVLPKHNRVRTVPLSPRLAAALASLPKRGLWVVSRLDGDALGYFGLNEAIVAVYDRAGVTRPPKPLHCLRHTFGTVCARRGMPLATLQDLLGHVSIETTRRYVTVTEDDKKDAITTVFGQTVAKTEGRIESNAESSSEK